jgi:hypothetical protein
MAKRSADAFGFVPLANFTSSKKVKTAGTPLISFSTFTRGNINDQNSIASLSGNPPISSFHADITPDNRIEDPSVSPIIVTFAVKFNNTSVKMFSKGVIVVADYTNAPIPKKRGPFKNIAVRSACTDAAKENDETIAVVLAESCSGPDSVTQTCLFSGAIADTTELIMPVTPNTWNVGEIGYAKLNKNPINGKTNDHITFSKTWSKTVVLTFQIVHKQQHKAANALVTILPTQMKV